MRSMKEQMKKWSAVLMAAAVLSGTAAVSSVSVNSPSVPAVKTVSTAASTSTYTLKSPTQSQIIEKFKSAGFNLSKSLTYSKTPSAKSPYAQGELSASDKNNALNALNFCRYVAGLPDVKLKADYNDLTQAAALVNAANNQLSHSPSKPAKMSDALYQKGKKGASSSNLGWGYANPAASVVYGFMSDTDSYNLPMVGHRRWCLNPSMQYTGFGQVGSYSAMYSFDRSRSAQLSSPFVMWPAKNMPYELYKAGGHTAFSVSVVSSSGYTVNKSKLKVTVTSTKLNKTWTLTTSSKPKNTSLYLNYDGYGEKPCIIFDVGTLPENDKVSVNIKGLFKGKTEKPLSYTVNFFNMTRVTLNKTSLTLGKGESATLTATAIDLNGKKGITWSSSNTNVASVDKNGKVTAKAVGTATVTATGTNGKKATCKITVKNAPSKVTLNKTSVTIAKGKTFQLTATLPENTASKKTFSSGNTNVATVNSSGLITAKKAGTATITVKTFNGKTASCKVTVK